MKNTSKYYKKKKKQMFSVLSENNNFFILPAIRIYYDKFYSGRGYDKLYLEFSWLNRTFAIKLK